MSSQPLIVEMAVLLLFAFVLGGLAGFWARRWLTPRGVSERPEDTVVQATIPEPSDETATSAGTPTPVETEQLSQPAAAVSDVAATAVASPVIPATEKPARKARKPRKAQEPEVVKSDESSVDETAGKPALLTAARDGEPDDLKKIKGIGPKIEGLLHGLGIYHYDQIAGWGAEEIAWVDDKLSFRGRIDREKWVSQAQALAQSNS